MTTPPAGDKLVKFLGGPYADTFARWDEKVATGRWRSNRGPWHRYILDPYTLTATWTEEE